MKKLLPALIVFCFYSLSRAGSYGFDGFQPIYKSTAIDTAVNHVILSTGCVHIGWVVPLSTATGARFSVADSSNRAFDYWEASTFSITELNAYPVFKSFERGLMVNSLSFGGAAGGSVMLLYDFFESSCYDNGSRLSQQ